MGSQQGNSPVLDRKGKLAVIWKRFRAQTTAHGVPHVDNARGGPKKFFWSIISLGCVAFLGYHIAMVTMYYLSRPVSVHIQLIQASELTFPAVTVCNMNPIKSSALISSPALQSVLGNSSTSSRRRKKRAIGDLIPTYGGTGNFEPCVFPFTSDGLQYISCVTTTDRPDPWCATSANYPTDDKWGYCIVNNQCPHLMYDDSGVNHCYWNPTGDKRNYQDAKQYCAARGAAMFVMDSKEKRDFLKDQELVETANGLSTWMFMERSGEDWYFSGTTLATWTNYKGLFPLAEGEDCITIEGPSLNMENDIPCDTGTSTILCEIVPPTVVLNELLPIVTTTTPAPAPVEIPEYKESFQKREQVLEILADMPVEEKRQLGYRPEEFLLDCQYAGFPCHSTQFQFFYDPMHGNCYIFNSGWNSTSELLTSSRPGRRFGLKIIFNVNQDEYVENLGDSAGVSVVVHDQKHMPFPQDSGIVAPPGRLTAVGVGRIEIERIGEPYGVCADPTIDNMESNVFEEIYPVNYSINGCLKTCYQSQTMKQCGCADPQFPADGAAFEKDSAYCATDKKAECNVKLRKWFQENAASCKCASSCSEVTYDTDVSIAQWPSNNYKDTILGDLEAKLVGTTLDLNEANVFRENLLTVEVFYQRFSYEYIKEKPGYPDATFISDLGGILGLWIGCSVLSLFEFFELFFDVLIVGLSCCRKAPVKVAATRRGIQGKRMIKRFRSGLSPPPPYCSRNSMLHGQRDFAYDDFMARGRMNPSNKAFCNDLELV